MLILAKCFYPPAAFFGLFCVYYSIQNISVFPVGDIYVLIACSLLFFHSDDKAKMAEDLTYDELDQYSSFLDNNPVMFELIDESTITQLGVY